MKYVKLNFWQKIQEFLDPMIEWASVQMVPNGYQVTVEYSLTGKKEIKLFDNDCEGNYTTYRSPEDAAKKYRAWMMAKRDRQKRNRSY